MSEEDVTSLVTHIIGLACKCNLKTLVGNSEFVTEPYIDLAICYNSKKVIFKEL